MLSLPTGIYLYCKLAARESRDQRDRKGGLHCSLRINAGTNFAHAFRWTINHLDEKEGKQPCG